MLYLSESLLWCLSCNWSAVEEIAQLRVLSNHHHRHWDADEDVFGSFLSTQVIISSARKAQYVYFCLILENNNENVMPLLKTVTRQVTGASNLLGKLHSHSPCTVSLVNLCISHTVIMTRKAWGSWADWLTVQIL